MPTEELFSSIQPSCFQLSCKIVPASKQFICSTGKCNYMKTKCPCLLVNVNMSCFIVHIRDCNVTWQIVSDFPVIKLKTHFMITMFVLFIYINSYSDKF